MIMEQPHNTQGNFREVNGCHQVIDLLGKHIGTIRAGFQTEISIYQRIPLAQPDLKYGNNKTIRIFRT